MRGIHRRDKSFIGWRKKLVLLIMLLILLSLSSCLRQQATAKKFYRECGGRVSFVVCPLPPRGYSALEAAPSGKANKLRNYEKDAILLIMSGKSDAEKITGLRELGFGSVRGARTLEYLMCSQYVDCVLPKEQYHQARKTLVRPLESNDF